MSKLDLITTEIYELASPQLKVKIDAARKMGIRKAGRELGFDNSNFNKSVNLLLKKAAKKNIAPYTDGHINSPAMEGFVIEKKSSFTSPQTGNVGGWKIEKPERQHLANMLKEYVAGLSQELTPINPIKKPKNSNKDLLNLYTLTDVHLGMLAWDKEGGDDWDIDIATQTVKSIFTDMINRSPSAKTCVINQGGDWSHYDSMNSVTPASGHMLDADSRPGKMAQAAGALIRFLITESLKKHEKVYVVLQEGNHDPYSHKKDVEWAIAWGELLTDAWSIDKSRLEFVTNEIPFYAVEFGNNMLGFHHGHKKGKEKLPQMFACQFRGMWGRCKYVDIHKGHYHSFDVLEQDGATVIQHPSIVARDAYASHNGYFSNRAALGISYHKEYGRQGITFSTPEMVGL